MTSGGDGAESVVERAGVLTSALLPPVVHEASAAVLVVDVERREVTYANDLAWELAPSTGLPVSVDEWSTAAGLRDVTGQVLPDGPAPEPDSPAESLLRIAQGQPVTGEAVTAARETAATNAREVLWVLGLPLTGAPAPMNNLTMVVFLPARNARAIAGAQESAVTLRDRAVLATRMSFTITDPRQPDNPLVWVNPAFTRTTGYEFEDAVGRNCRFLQGKNTERSIVAEIRTSIEAARPLTTTLLNYRKDGTHFWNELSISPVRDAAGEVTHFVGVQADVTARVEAQQARDDALSQVAMAADRLALLADFTSRMAMSRAPNQILELLSEVLVPQVGTYCLIYTYDETGHLAPPYVRHARGSDPEVAAVVDRLRESGTDALRETGPVFRLLRGDDRDVLIEDFDAAPSTVTGSDEGARADLLHELGTGSVAGVPLLARAGIVGCVVLVADHDRPPLGETEVALLRDLAVRGGLMLENTQLYAQERRTAAVLQRSLLPQVPVLDDVEVAARYEPAADEAAVGGDWYDVFALREQENGRGVGVVLGDVMGHNVDSAAGMGKLSTILRSYAWPGSDPRDVLTAADELLAGNETGLLATCVYARLDRAEGGAELRYSSAGHPPAVVRWPDGSATTIDDGRGTMLGVSGLSGNTGPRPETKVLLPSGSTFVCFTDGLIDSVTDAPDLDEGLAAIVRLAAALPADASPQQLVDELLGATALQKDDVAVVAVRVR